ncbi:SIMPL domain-containing protein [Paracoccus seriniphilus]|uniref:SIMPL domain-containing protein n=1 Tax=Paracoccus seriniphilus TaxID=184748 RepID=A0A239PRM1_9RHOB|nr:SIMPL domain-containing protein [Paracoccus seriniphilus]WCR12797.1 SIMPL domain-containing protein [Paracoccus seriniphilus]SNT72788.1 hypothetical protein SAMN05444959_103291 [Paracoccus seriniphilus]
MYRFPVQLGRTALIASTVLALWAVGPADAGPGKSGGMTHGGAMCQQDIGRLTVTGQGEARLVPDMASIQVGVTTQGESAAEAMSQNSAQQGAVIEALKAAGIVGKDIQTSGLNLSPMMDYGDNRAPRVTGYQARNMVSVRVSDLAALGEVLDALVTAGANEINGISFGREDGREAEDEARRAAVQDARHKAGILAEAAGQKLGRVIRMQASAQSGGGPRPMMMRAEASMSKDVPVEAGELSFGAQVQMEFALIDENACAPRPDRKKGHKGKDGAAHNQADAPAQGEATE